MGGETAAHSTRAGAQIDRPMMLLKQKHVHVGLMLGQSRLTPGW